MLALAWLGPLPALAARFFTGHMIMHVLVLTVAAPMLGYALPRLLPSGTKSRWFFSKLAIPASLLELVVVWAWHAPELPAFARQTTTGLVMEQASFLTVDLMLWTTALQPRSTDGGTVAAGIVALLLTSMHMTLLGALIALSPRILYTCYIEVSGTSPFAALLGDQHMGGALMILVASGVYLCAGLARLSSLLDGGAATATT